MFHGSFEVSLKWKDIRHHQNITTMQLNIIRMLIHPPTFKTGSDYFPNNHKHVSHCGDTHLENHKIS